MIEADPEDAARFRVLSELVSDCCWVRRVDSQGATQRAWFNKGLEKLTGYSPEEFNQLGRERLVHPDDLEMALRFVTGPIGFSQLEYRILHKDGSVRWLSERMLIEQEDSCLVIYGATWDITSQKEAEAVLQGSKEDLEVLVRQRTSSLTQAVDSLRREVSEHKKTTDLLREATTKARTADLAKSAFLARMSHDLRTPLNGILGSASVVRAQLTDPELTTLVDSIRFSGEVLLELVSDLLDLSKIELGKLDVRSTSESIRESIGSVIQMMSRNAAEKLVTLHASIAPDVPLSFETDHRRLRRVLINLIDNAVRYTDQGRVVIDVRRAPAAQFEGDGLIIEIRDTGIGVSPEDLETLFEPFVQVGQKGSGGKAGSGLGLAISARLVAMLGGEIGASSQVGDGSVFRIVLPRMPISSHATDQQEAAATEKAPLRLRVLLAEDDPINQLVVTSQLKLLGCDHSLVDNGQQALERFAERDWDVVLMDVQMPGMDGVEATRRLRQTEFDEERQPTVVIGLTAFAGAEYHESCLSAGMDEVLAKPVTVDQLREVMLRTVGEKSLVQRLLANGQSLT